MDWGIYLQKRHLIKDCYLKYTENIQKLLKKIISLKNGPKTFTETSPKKIYRWQISI